MKIDGLDTVTGELRISGRVDRLAYVEAKKKKRISLLEALKK